MRKFAKIASAVAVGALLLTACAGDGGETTTGDDDTDVTADSGGTEEEDQTADSGSEGDAAGGESEFDRGAPPPVEDATELRVAYFSAGSSNQYLQAAIDEADVVAEELGFELDVFDGEFDAQVQFDQIQTAIQSGRYNAFAVEPNDGNLVCDILTEDAREAGIIVSIFNLPICGRATNVGVETWQPGTITYVGGQTLDVYELWVQEIIDNNPDGANIAIITGPDLNANSIVAFEAAEAFAEEEGFEVVAEQTTDYTTTEAANAAQDIIQSNPELDVIMSNFSGMTRGIVSVMPDDRDIAIYDFGGDQWAFDAVESGDILSTIVMLPRVETRRSLEALAGYVEGEDVPRFFNLIEEDVLPGTPFVTADNINEFKPELPEY